MRPHSTLLATARTLGNMKTSQRRATRHTTGNTARKVIGHGAEPTRSPQPAAETAPAADMARVVGPGTYEVRLDIVSTHQSPDPAQIPWLAEIRRDQHLNDTFSEVI